MSYQQFSPHPELAPYIDAYWQVTANGTKPTTQRILPDGCVDIIVNLGAELASGTGDFSMKNEKGYLVGTMTRYKETIIKAGTHLIGIRFKPAAFTHFYQYASQHEFANKTIEFEQHLTPPINTSTRDLTGSLDRFFLDRLLPVRESLFPMIRVIYHSRGQISVAALAQSHYSSVRKLERSFKQHIGVSPKEFINFVRYQFALQHIRKDYATKSLMDIALDSGYYDHAHLANEIKKHSGLVPSEL
jgi:AraC-like DNA-binding protein